MIVRYIDHDRRKYTDHDRKKYTGRDGTELRIRICIPIIIREYEISRIRPITIRALRGLKCESRTRAPHALLLDPSRPASTLT